MSVAFTKEDSAETASETLLPDRPISSHPNLVTEAGLKALEFQLQQAREAYETAQTIEDVNERRRQAATPLRRTLHLELTAAAVRSELYTRNAVRSERQCEDGSWDVEVELDLTEVAKLLGAKGVKEVESAGASRKAREQRVA